MSRLAKAAGAAPGSDPAARVAPLTQAAARSQAARRLATSVLFDYERPMAELSESHRIGESRCFSWRHGAALVTLCEVIRCDNSIRIVVFNYSYDCLE